MVLVDGAGANKQGAKPLRPRSMGPCLPPSLKLRRALLQTPAKPRRRRVAGTTGHHRFLPSNGVILILERSTPSMQLTFTATTSLTSALGPRANTCPPQP